MRLKIDPCFQTLQIKRHGLFETLKDECSLSFYEVLDFESIYLESIAITNPKEVSFFHFYNQEIKHGKSVIHNKQVVEKQKYLAKLGVIKNNEEGANKQAELIEKLNQTIKTATQEDFITYLKSIDNEVNLDHLGLSEWNCLHTAAKYTNLEIGQFLLNTRKCNPNITGFGTWTPLELAVQSGSLEFTNMLLKDHRIKKDIVDPQRGTPLHIAAKNNNLQICQMLLLQGFDFRTPDSNDHLPSELCTNTKVKKLFDMYYAANPQPSESGIDEIREELFEEDEDDQEEEKVQQLRIPQKMPSDTSLNLNSSIRGAMASQPKSPEQNQDLSQNTVKQFSKSPTARDGFNSSLLYKNRAIQKTDRKTSNQYEPKQQSRIEKYARKYTSNMSPKNSFEDVPSSNQEDISIFQQNKDSAKSVMIKPHGMTTIEPQSPQPRLADMRSAFEEIISLPVTTIQQITRLTERFKSEPQFIDCIYRVKGSIQKLKLLKTVRVQRYLYLNPLEGVLIEYQSLSQFPQKPHYILKFIDIVELTKMDEQKWFIKKNFMHFKLKSENKTYIFCCDNKDIVEFWVEQISRSQKFSIWIQGIIDLRYSLVGSSEDDRELRKAADDLINAISRVHLPEVDLSQFKSKSLQEIRQFTRGLKASTAQSSGSGNAQGADSGKTPNTEDCQSKHSSLKSGSPIEADNLKQQVENQQEIVYEFDNNKGDEMRKTVPVMANSNQLLQLDENIGFKSFDVLEILGQGTFGKVFKVTKKDAIIPEIYAMKVLKKSYLVKNHHLKYAISECNIMKQMDHPFILKMHYSFQTPENLYMILDICEGGDLSYHLNSKQILEEKEAQFFIAEVILAIEYIHTFSIVYRDLKPENILIDSQGHTRLADFGLAKEGVGGSQAARSFCGSPAYLAPEMLANKGVGKASDIYQIGACLYEMLVGFPPYYTENIKKLYESIKQANLQIPTYISPQAKDLLQKLLNKNPKKRLGVNDKNEIKRHPFFRGLDWQKLERKEIDPPIRLELDPNDADDEELQFLKQAEKAKFKDMDYTETNKTLNRVKQFTFVGANPMSPDESHEME